MAKIGYIYVVSEDEELASIRKWMSEYGCMQVIEDAANPKNLRPAWHRMIDSLERGDELIVSKFSNAVSQIRELTTLIEFCRVKMVRLISINDRVDTKDELFPDTTPSQVMVMFSSFSYEVSALRKNVNQINKHKKIIRPREKVSLLSLDRDKRIVEMYKRNYSMDQILKDSGFRSLSSIFRILNKFGVELNRGQFSGPIGPRKKKEESL